jgi:SnoaL-like domain
MSKAPLDPVTLYLLDRLEIQDVIALYASGQDDHQGHGPGLLDDWDRVFTSDAIVDYTQAGPPFGVCSHRELAQVMRGGGAAPGVMNGAFVAWQHMLGLPRVTINGDNAVARTDLFATHVGRAGAGTPWHLFDAAVFHDRLLRTEAGWRIAHRRLLVHYVEVVLTEPTDRVPALIGGVAA